MFSYIKKLQYPVNIKKADPRAAQIILSQYGGAIGRRYGTKKRLRLAVF